MSSDTFHVWIQAIKGTTVDLLCRTSTAGGLNDFAITRSFALMAIEDCLPYRGKTPLQVKMRELGGETPPVWEASFHRQHVGTFIASTELVERSGIIDDVAAWSEGRFAEATPDFQDLYPLHRFVLRVQMTDPQWLKGVKVGAHGGTTAFDAWWDDPTRPTKAQVDAVTRKASRWQAPGATAKPAKKTTAKRTAKKTAAKTAAAKKTTAKKTTAKKTAAKKTAAKKTAKSAPAKKTAKKAAKKRSSR